MEALKQAGVPLESTQIHFQKELQHEGLPMDRYNRSYAVTGLPGHDSQRCSAARPPAPSPLRIPDTDISHAQSSHDRR